MGVPRAVMVSCEVSEPGTARHGYSLCGARGVRPELHDRGVSVGLPKALQQLGGEGMRGLAIRAQFAKEGRAQPHGATGQPHERHAHLVVPLAEANPVGDDDVAQLDRGTYHVLVDDLPRHADEPAQRVEVRECLLLDDRIEQGGTSARSGRTGVSMVNLRLMPASGRRADEA